jgi:hypothetical protein
LKTDIYHLEFTIVAIWGGDDWVRLYYMGVKSIDFLLRIELYFIIIIFKFLIEAKFYPWLRSILGGKA